MLEAEGTWPPFRGQQSGVALVGLTVFMLWWWDPQQVEMQFFWVDLLAGAAATLFAGCAQRPGGLVARALPTRGPRWLGQSSYSLCLIHLPVLGLGYWGAVVRLSEVSEARFLFLLTLGIPMAVLASCLFWWTFERPFMQHRSIRGLAGAWRRMRVRPARIAE